jgi:hypothetical protein
MTGDNNDLNRSPDRGLGGSILAALAVVVVLAIVWMLTPWSGSRTADNTGPGTTVGSTANRPAAPLAPTTPAPAAPTTAR